MADSTEPAEVKKTVAKASAPHNRSWFWKVSKKNRRKSASYKCLRYDYSRKAEYKPRLNRKKIHGSEFVFSLRRSDRIAVSRRINYQERISDLDDSSDSFETEVSSEEDFLPLSEVLQFKPDRPKKLDVMARYQALMAMPEQEPHVGAFDKKVDRFGQMTEGYWNTKKDDTWGFDCLTLNDGVSKKSKGKEVAPFSDRKNNDPARGRAATSYNCEDDPDEDAKTALWAWKTEDNGGQ